MSPGERAFLPALQAALRSVAAERGLPNPVVFPSVRLAEVLQVGIPQQQNRSLWQIGFNRIHGKQVDFVVCEPTTTRPFLVVELDDSSHSRPDRRERDGFVDEACASARLPVLHVSARASYDPAALARDIGDKLRPASV